MLWIVLGVYTLIGVLFAGQVWLDYQYLRVPISWPRALIISGIDWYLWAALTPGIWWLGRRFPFARVRVAKALAVHVPLCFFITVLKLPIQEVIGGVLAGVTRQPASFLKVYVTLLTYWAILGVGIGISNQRERRARELRASQLEAELARAQLDGLQSRLHPHFLFNTLNGISGLMRDNVEAADVMLTRLSELLRLTLARADVQEVALNDEIDVVQRYLDIQQIRFGDRLTFTIDVAPESLHAAVPSLSLQPLVENALKHGIEKTPGPGHVCLRARVTDGCLQIEVVDDGPGPPATVTHGTGLQTTVRRLEHLYGAAASLKLIPHSGGGSAAQLTIPARFLR